MARRNGRQRGQLPTCYYEGYLEKRSFKDKTSRKLWSCLCGNILFFFNDKRDVDYVDRLDVSEVITIVDDGSQDRNLDAARFTITTKQGNVKLTAPNAEARELWKGYIFSVSKLSVPSSLNLLPGQFHMLKEAVDLEKERQKKAPQHVITSRSFDSSDADLPSCYHSVSRLEAELLLEKESKKGNLLLRPGGAGNSFSITTRQEDHDGAIFRHYRVSRTHDGGFAIALENPVPCATLQDVVNYLVEKTDRVLIPLIFEEQYEKNIIFIQSNNENGEISVQQALPNIVPPKVVLPNIVPPKVVPPKVVPPKVVPPNIVPPNIVPPKVVPSNIVPSNIVPPKVVPPKVPPSLPPKPVGLKIPTTEEALTPVSEPVNEFGQTNRSTEDSALQPLRKTPTIKPPVPAPRKSLSGAPAPSVASYTNIEQRMRLHTDPFEQTISQLKLMFEQSAK
ncbi:signal-transducing adaptor protein 1-like [Solea solea]|uniref:signal-transducing adaptor protein 1-like n=1 Tax=Solea solea TaxID=90069 RepID=UPI00272C4331|nr:signal-transducing adaptor protein 1-like [Solea solea]